MFNLPPFSYCVCGERVPIEDAGEHIGCSLDNPDAGFPRLLCPVCLTPTSPWRCSCEATRITFRLAA